ncbi:MAG: DUF6391 domain-containing protein [Anaerolineae bacterium]|nr:DUF6391 domain-containing protein [Anaerolineae bacterium]
MLEQLAVLAKPILAVPFIRRTRRNHGLEHATVHLLSRKFRGAPLMGRSTDQGFVLFADVPQAEVETAVREALSRMKRGEHSLAIHPGCGTSRLTTGILTSLVGIIAASGVSRKTAFNRLPYMMMLMMLAVLVSEPLGLGLQKYFTTDGDPGDLEVLGVTSRDARMPLTFQPITLYTIQTHST